MSLFENQTKMISKNDYLEFRKQLFFKREKIKQYFYLIGGIVLFGLGVYGTVTRQYLGCALAYFLAVFYLYSSKNYYKMMASRYYLNLSKVAKENYSWEFFEDKAVRKTDDGEIQIDYKDIKDIFEADDCVVLYANRVAYWVDKNGFSKGSYEEFKIFINSKVDR